MTANKTSTKRAAGGSASSSEVPLDRTVTYRLHLLHKLSDRDSQRAYLNDAGMPLSEARCLGAIGSFAPLSVKDLAQRANLNKGQASRAAQALVEQGFVQKQVSGTDGRGVVLTLTRKGAQAWRRVMQVIARRNEEIVACLSPAEREQLSRLFDRMIAQARAGSDAAMDDGD